MRFRFSLDFFAFGFPFTFTVGLSFFHSLFDTFLKTFFDTLPTAA
uniref:Uncharacterized protein n=1 Tax=Candidatus Kentrum sp. MB TaxID=2138164 RepID=A0A451BAK0_9GAMM|nr:MAG: hypothetical protein BECKMB1821G_GA0114241_100759 [Candidatus Kentron sp. MB]VFK30577.1 MAG: hypothetical protein BECKMB1821I_GA0114274_101641 [Candidatus Kentron sp. MB]VFK75308.1 MAG: hypothetical protein BECKMB1821H_GA0114242_101940 [Candidatus Kentron sp. MB]